MKAVEATTDTDEMYCIVTSKGLWLVAFDGSVGPTFIAYPQQMNETASNPHYGPPPAISTQSAKNTKPDSSKKTSTVTEPIDDQQVGNFAENDPVAKPLSNEDKHAAGESPESPGSKRSADVHERLPPDKRSQMLPPTAGPKASHTSKHQSCAINSNDAETRTCIYIYIYIYIISFSPWEDWITLSYI